MIFDELSAGKAYCHTLEHIERQTDRDNFMSAEEAREFNLIDQVISTLKDIQKR